MRTRWWWGGLLGLLAGGMASAAVLTLDSGTFDTVAGVAATATTVQVDGRVNLLIYLTGTIGTATAQCQQSGDGTNWTNVGSTAAALGVLCNINYPTGFYRVNFTACSAGCSVTPKYKAVRLK